MSAEPEGPEAAPLPAPEPVEAWTEPTVDPPAAQKDWPTLLLAGGLGLATVVLAIAVLTGVAMGERDLTEAGVRAITVAVTAAAGVLGFQVGKAALKKTK